MRPNKEISQEQKDRIKKQILDFLDEHEAIWKESHETRSKALRWFVALGDAEQLLQENLRGIAEYIVDRRPIPVEEDELIEYATVWDDDSCEWFLDMMAQWMGINR